MFQKIISEFKQFQTEKESFIKQINKVSKEKKESESKISALYDQKPFLSRFFDFRTREEIEKIKKEIYKLESEIQSNQKEIIENFNALSSNIVVSLINEDKESQKVLSELTEKHNHIQSITNALLDVKYCSERTRSSIQTAIQQIQSAKMLETIDMASNNKANSLMSTAYNHTAAQYIGYANSSINVLKTKISVLDDLIDNFKSQKINTVNDITSELYIHNFYTGIVNSFMTLNTLTVAESSLQETYGKVNEIIEKSSKEYDTFFSELNEISNKINIIKLKFENQAKEILVANSIFIKK